MKKFPENLIWWTKNPKAFARRIAGKIYRRFNPNEPWISLAAIEYCQSRLSPSTKALEWGSGRSTVWFAKILGHITSVEDNRSWFEQVTQKLTTQRLTNVDYRFVPLDHPITEPAKKFYPVVPKYVAVAENFQDEELDFVVVDGHYRQACIQAALPKLKPKGLLLVDNSNWMKREDWGVPTDWPVVHCSFGFDGETTIWQKP